MKKKNLLEKKLLYVSFIPYIVFLLICLKSAIFGVCYDFMDECYYGLEGVKEAFNDLFFDFLFGPWFLLIVAIIFYQLWYFIFRFETKIEKNMKKNSKANKKAEVDDEVVKFNLKKILFVLAVLVWIYYLGMGVYYFFAGTCVGMLDCEMIYGFDAMFEFYFLNGFMLTMIPVLPITLLYMILYLIKDKKNKANK